MRLPIVEQALHACGQHLKQTQATGTEIEAYLTRSMLVLICAAFEEEIIKIILSRISKTNDAEVTSFVELNMRFIVRSIKTSEISGLLDKFSSTYKEKFREKLKQNEKAETFYNNIITNRNDIAHSSSTNITFSELQDYYNEGHTILDFIKNSLLQNT